MYFDVVYTSLIYPEVNKVISGMNAYLNLNYVINRPKTFSPILNKIKQKIIREHYIPRGDFLTVIIPAFKC